MIYLESVITSKNSGIRELLSQKSYTLMILANLISRFGDSIDSIAMGWMVYVLTGSKLLLGALFAVNAIPGIVLSPFTGVLVDYLPKKKVVILGDLGRGLIVSLIALLFFTENLEPWHLFVFTFLNSTLETFVNNARFSLIPSFLPKKLMVAGSSFSTSTSSFAEIVGLGVAGFLIGLLGISGAIFIDGITFFASCFIISFIRTREEGAEIKSLNLKSYFQNMGEGFKYVIKDKLIIITILLAAFANFCLAPISILMPAFSEEMLRSGATGLSLLGVGLSSGIIVGGLITSQFGGKFKKGKLFVVGMSSMAASYALLGGVGKINISPITPLAMAVALFFLMGFFIPVATAPLKAYIMVKTPGNLLGRVGSVTGMFSLSAMPLGGVFTGIAAKNMSMSFIFIIMGSVMMAVTFLPLLNKDFRNA